MLTGGRLFEGDGDVAVLRAVQQRAIPPPARLNPDVPAELDAVVMKALQRDPDARYATAQELERALAQFVLTRRQTLEDTDVGAYLRKLTTEEVTGGTPGSPGEVDPDPADPRHSDPTARAPLNPDEDPNADTYVLARDGTVQQGIPRHGRPTVPMQGIAQAIADKEKSRISRPNPVPEPHSVSLSPLPRPTVGMRRGALAALALFALAAAAAGITAWRASRAEAPRSSEDAGALPAAVSPAAAPPLSGVLPPPAAEPAADATPGKAPLSPPNGGRAPPVADAGPVEAAFGTLVVRATPWAQVIIDGQSRDAVYGTRSFKLSAGKHRLRFVHPRGAQEMWISIEPAKSLMREFDAFKPH
jgi:eukaryotic-like serine/threonine-protein kinase